VAAPVPVSLFFYDDKAIKKIPGFILCLWRMGRMKRLILLANTGLFRLLLDMNGYGMTEL